LENTLDAVEFPLSARVRGARRWLVVTSAAGAVCVGAAVASVVADASGWVSVSRAIQAGSVLVTLFVLPVVWVGVHAVWALRGRAELFLAAGEHPRRRPTDRQMVDHLRDEHPLTPLWWMVSVLGGLGTLCLGVALPFALADGAVLAGVLLGTGLAVSLAALVLAVSGIRRAARQGSEDRRRRAELWSLPSAVERRLTNSLLGSGDGGHLGA
jgi:O-antigen ligase